MKYLILGKTGLLGQALIEEAMIRNLDFVAVGSSQEDLIYNYRLEELIEKEHPDCIINSIAYTQVDQAEEQHQQAYLLNSTFPNNLAVVCKTRNIKLIHLSTDYVFDGIKESPYLEKDKVNPQSVYGCSKLEGEKRIQEINPKGWLILRVSWLFGPHKENFLSKILQKALNGDSLKIVKDQFGNPTYTIDLAKAIFDLIDLKAAGLYHYANSGSCTWYEFATYFLAHFPIDVPIFPCLTEEFKTLAKRPKYSRFNLEKISTIIPQPRNWARAVQDYANRLKDKQI